MFDSAYFKTEVEKLHSYCVRVKHPRTTIFLSKVQKKKAAQLPRPPELPLKWIEKNWEDLRSQWLKFRDENENQNQKTKYNFAAMSEPQHQMWYKQLQVVVDGVIESGDSTSLELWLQDDFHNSWLGWAKTARQDVREFWASHPILEQKNYGS